VKYSLSRDARKIFDMDSKERIGVVYNPAS